MPLPALDPTSGNLPPGLHVATWAEVVAQFGWNARRLQLLAGLHAALVDLAKAGCRRAYVNGSFATGKDVPGDYDGCWEAAGVDPAALDPVLLNFGPGRVAQKTKFGGELFIASAAATPHGTVFLDFFQRDKTTGQPKGIIAIDLGGFA